MTSARANLSQESAILESNKCKDIRGFGLPCPIKTVVILLPSISITWCEQCMKLEMVSKCISKNLPCRCPWLDCLQIGKVQQGCHSPWLCSSCRWAHIFSVFMCRMQRVREWKTDMWRSVEQFLEDEPIVKVWPHWSPTVMIFSMSEPPFLLNNFVYVLGS